MRFHHWAGIEHVMNSFPNHFKANHKSGAAKQPVNTEKLLYGQNEFPSLGRF
jgi:hypothetical protein